MTCKHCSKDNRPEAKYCRFCGEPLEAAEPAQKGLIGKDAIIPVLDDLDRKLKVAGVLAKGGARIDLDCLILGDSGSGKTFIAGIIAEKMKAAGVVKSAPKVVDAADWGEFATDFDNSIAALKDGILLITNAQKLLPTSKASEVNQLDKLFTRMRGVEGAPIVLLCGLVNDISEFLEHNKDVYRLFAFEFRLGAFNIADLTSLTKSIITSKFGKKIADGVEKRLSAHFAWCMRRTDNSHTNGHLAEKTAENLCVKAAYRGSDVVEEQDIDLGECFIPKSEDQIMAELDSFIGLQSVKDEIRTIISSVKRRKEKGVKDKLIKDHYIFTGNPGTGKTTLARKFGEVLNAIGALPTGQFVEVSAKDFIGQYLGDTEANVKSYVNKAMGGVLFIDEAYALGITTHHKDGGSYGLDAVNTLLTLLENRRGEFVCIMAGYTKEMGEFVRLNPGLPRRMNVTIEFPDYNARELEQIFRMYLARNDENVVFTLDTKAEEMLPKVFDKMWLRRGDTFGNAGEVRSLFELAVKRSRMRGADDGVLTYADIVGEDATEEVSVEDVMKEFDSFVGMNSVKDAIRRIAQEIAVQKQLIEMGEASEGLTKFNFILTGNPGTGKSTVARIFGRIFKALGVTSTDRVVEKKPENIISKYVNESSQNMNDAINEAMGGVLFLDEAYDLEPMDAAGQSTSSEGRDAVRTLMTRMEDEAGKFVVICAGYPRQMADFMNSNPGLRRRFSHTIHIDDYTAEELLEIYERAARGKAYDFVLADESVRAKALSMFRNMVAMKDEKFGNAGEAIKKVAETKTNINNRIIDIPPAEWTHELLHTALAEDIPYVEPQKVSVEECLDELNALVGLEGVKTALTRLAHTIKIGRAHV